MSQRIHLLMEDPNDKNIVLTLSVKDGVLLVIMAANPTGNFQILTSH